MRTVSWLASLVLLAGCASAGDRVQAVRHVERGELSQALEVYERGADRDVLAGIAEALLERDALSQDAGTRHAAFSELSVAGQGAHALLRRLAEQQAQPVTQVLALRALLHAGHTSVRDDLAAFATHADPDVADVAFVALDAERDHTVLLTGLSAPRSARRAAALAVLRKHVGHSMVPAFVEVARRDPDASLRAAAIHALASEASALDVVVAALDDADSVVRTAAIAALVQTRREASLPFVSRFLDGKITLEAIETAAALLRAQLASEEGRARQALAKALDDKDPTLRARAALAIEGAAPHVLTSTALVARLPKETVAEVRLAMALALGAQDAAARATLVDLSDDETVVAVSAAAALASLGDADALTRLRALLRSPTKAVRISLARALGSELARPLEIRSLLADSEPAVQRAAAGAVLRSLE